MLTLEKIKFLLKKNYNINVKKIKKIDDGSAELWIINMKYVLKYYPIDFNVDKIMNGISVCNYLYNLNYYVPTYYKCLDDSYYFVFDKRYGVLMKYLFGKKINAFHANKFQLLDSAKFYSKLVCDLRKYANELPYYNIEKYTLYNKKKSIEEINCLINLTKNKSIRRDLLLRINLINSLDENIFNDINNVTICNCHGDYYISQCLYKKNHIKGILDFESVKKMPLVVEIIRSYIYLDNRINIENLIIYVAIFNKYIKLNKYDMYYMPYLYYIYLLRSTFGYKQYIQNHENKQEYLLLAKKMQSQIIYLSENLEIISKNLLKIVVNN